MLRSPVVVGRDRELSEIRRALDRARSGEGGCLFVVGEAGSGKTRVLQEARAEARRRGMTFLGGNVPPAWTSNRLGRLVKSPKRYLVDPALVGAALRLDLGAVLRHGDLLGRLLDTFVASQIRPELEVTKTRPRLYHLRQREGRHESDLLAEMAGSEVVAIEVKASAAPGVSDARHLAWLRDTLGDRFLMGAVLHTGTRRFSLGERLVAVPVCSLWG